MSLRFDGIATVSIDRDRRFSRNGGRRYRRSKHPSTRLSKDVFEFGVIYQERKAKAVRDT